MAEETHEPPHENPPSGLEEKLPQGGAAGHEAKIPKSTLESVVSEASDFFRSASKVGLAAAIPLGFAGAYPSLARDTAILTGAQIASDYTGAYQKGKKYTSTNLLESAALGTAMTPVLEGMFGVVRSLPLNTPMDYAVKAGVWGGLCYPAFVGLYQPAAYLIRNRTFKGMGTYIKENYWPTLKKAWKLLPFSLANIFFAPAWLQIPISAGLSYIFDRFGAPQKDDVKEDEKRDKTPYLQAATSVTKKFYSNAVNGVIEPISLLGKTLDSYFSGAAPPPKAAPAPHQA